MTTDTNPATLKLDRVFDATPERLWSYWTDPKKYAKWMNPAGKDLIIHEMDVRPGGKVSFDMPLADGTLMRNDGVFHSLTPHTELVTGAPDKSFYLTVRFEPVDAKRTRMVVVAVGIPPEHHAMATEGWGQCFDNLAGLL